MLYVLVCAFNKNMYFCGLMYQLRLHLNYICALGMVAISMVACHQEDEPPRPPIYGAPGDTLMQTVIFYMAAENSLSRYSLEDSLEIIEAIDSIPESARVVMFLDNVRSSRISVGRRNESMHVVKTFEENVSSTDSAQMDAILHWIVETYPSRHYGLVLWSHASGWRFYSPEAKAVQRRSFGKESGNRTATDDGSEMNIPTLARILEGLPHFDFIIADACFMQSIEVAYELRRVADYIISSPAEIPGTGAPYQNVLVPMCSVPADVEKVVMDYVDYYVNGRGHWSFAGAEISMICTDFLEQLAEATYPLIQQLFGLRSIPDCSFVQYYANPVRWGSFTECYDMKNLMYKNLSESDYTTWLKAYEKAVPLVALTPRWTTGYSMRSMEMNDIEHCGGVSMFVPNESYESRGWTDNYRTLEWAKAVGFDQTGW